MAYAELAQDVCMPLLPVDACIANLSLGSECDATVGELDECFETIYRGRRVQYGCDPLLTNPNCAGVMVLRVESKAPCPLPFP